VADLCRGLAAGGLRGRTVTLKIRLRPFRTYTRSRTIEVHTRDRSTITRVARELFGAFERDAPVRLLGVGVGSLVRDARASQPPQERLELRSGASRA
jgi:DNA polymerase-4